MKKVLIIGLTATLSLAMLAAGFAGKGPGGQHREYDPLKLIEMAGPEIGLTAQQQQTLKNRFFASEKDEIALEAKIKTARLELKQLMDADSPDESAVYRKVDEMGKLRTEMQKLHTGNRLAVKAMLTTEQEQKLKELRREHRQDLREHDRDDREGREKMRERFNDPDDRG